ncbi:MAG: exported protein of unknown function [Thermoleophilia bacterium]|nr:exported protein of unknown function [Thermoleophilia bacterium]
MTRQSALAVRAIPLFAALVLLVACDGSDSMKAEHGSGEIAFTVNRTGWNEIWLMAADGSDRRRLTEVEPPQSDAAGSASPAWSPDGTQIAFAAQIGTLAEDPRLSEIYVMDADGTDRRRLTTNDDVDTSPSWSPDGKRIAFTRIVDQGTAGARSGIFVLGEAGDDEVQLTQAAWPTFDFSPAWSPDGSMIAFTRIAPSTGSESPSAALYLVALEGRTLRKLTSDGGEPDWSPDGKRIAFTSFRDRFGRTCFHECGTSGEIYVVGADGREEQRLTESQANDGSPAWSQDGRLIAFASDRSNPNAHEIEIYVMNANGDDVRRITENEVWDGEPAWRP